VAAGAAEAGFGPGGGLGAGAGVGAPEACGVLLMVSIPPRCAIRLRN